jgi:tetratricopeptide (TPR) repeat protein
VAPPRPIQGEALDEDELPGIVIPQLPSASQPQPPLGKGAKRPSPPAAAKAAVEADESLSWLDQVIAEPKAAESAASDEKLFEDEEGFFDLAAELEQELSKDDLMAGQDLLGQQEQTLEEIVEGFKKGVAETLSPEDYDTHYNLGIAYREMGLLDEAIGEFQLAAKEPRYLVDCCSLLGASFLEKGLPELAIKWYRRGLESPGLSEDATCGLLYDLGNLYMSTSDMEAARKTFVEIYGINTNYRDVVAKLAELGA